MIFVIFVNIFENWMNNVYNLEIIVFDFDFNFLCEFFERIEFLIMLCVVFEDEFSYMVGIVKMCEFDLFEKEIENDFVMWLFIRGLFSFLVLYRMIKIKDIVFNLDENSIFIDVLLF